MNYYEMLNVSKSASEKEIKNAYRKLAKKYHPDTYQGNKSVAEEKMKQINEAYDVLSNKELKSKYDEQFNQPKTEQRNNDNYSTSYYNYETYEYRSPDPRDADYRNYYNYSPDDEYDEYEPAYDFSKLKNIFGGTSWSCKVAIIIILLFNIVLFLLYSVKSIYKELVNFTTVNFGTSDYQTNYNEKLPDQFNDYASEENNNFYELPDIKLQQGVLKDITDPDKIDEKIKGFETEFNNWYETEGKEYEQQLKDELNLWYEELKKQIVNN